MPIYGKLADLFGAQAGVLTGTVLFLVGRCCAVRRRLGAVDRLPACCRPGAGGMLPITQTILGDLYPLSSAHASPAGSSTVWGVSGLLGPGIGGFLPST